MERVAREDGKNRTGETKTRPGKQNTRGPKKPLAQQKPRRSLTSERRGRNREEATMIVPSFPTL